MRVRVRVRVSVRVRLRVIVGARARARGRVGVTLIAACAAWSAAWAAPAWVLALRGGGSVLGRSPSHRIQSASKTWLALG